MARRKQLWKRSKHRAARVYRPCFEVLEDRLVPSTVTFNDFSSTAGLTLSGIAASRSTGDGQVLNLASAFGGAPGGAFTTETVDITRPFSTQFAFRITNPISGGADGFTFTLQTGTAANSSSGGGFLGYAGILNSVAVEFDTHQNSEAEGVIDPSGNHIGIDQAGDVSGPAVDVTDINFESGSICFVWIDYDGQSLEVRISNSSLKPQSAKITQAIDIVQVLGQDVAHVGFTGATGGATEDIDILYWDFINATVPGTSNLWLAGMPDGTPSIDGNDVAPDESPYLVSGLHLVPGQELAFFVDGWVDNNSATSSIWDADGDLTRFASHYTGNDYNLSDIFAPYNSLIGVFLTDSQPNTMPSPAALAFGGEGSVPGGINYLVLAPELQQTFFIGDGLTDSFIPQRIVVPTGATRLFLGTMDEFGWYNNTGAFEVKVYSVGISGPSSVLAGTPYTLDLDYPDNGDTNIHHVVIDWGDGTVEQILGQPSTATHIYTDAPNGYLIKARIVGEFVSAESNSVLVTVAVPEDHGSQASNLVEPGNTETFTVGGISATTFNNSRFNNIIVTLGVYQDNPVDKLTPTVTTIGNTTFLTTPLGTEAEVISYEMRATTPLPGDVIVARFTIPNIGFAPKLFFFDELLGKYMPVHGSTKIPNSFRQIGNVFEVIFDETSFPTSLLLRGTVFTITDASALIPSLVTVAQPPPPRPPLSAADAFNGLLDTGAQASGGSTVGVVAPTQVNAFTGQNTGAGDSPENAEGRRLSRQIQSVLDGVYEQMRSIFLPQVYFDPSAVETPPHADSSTPAPTPAEPLAAEPAWAREEIALTPPTPAHAIEVALAPSVSHTSSWLFSERALICLSIAALPIMLATDIPAPASPPKGFRKKRKARRR